MKSEIFRINDLKIKKYRGIKDLNLENCNNVNLILGDNNSGKTSILESIYALRSGEMGNIIDILKFRHSGLLGTNDFKFLFPINDNCLDVDAVTSTGNVDFRMDYKLENVQFNSDLFLSNQPKTNAKLISSLIKMLKVENKTVQRLFGKKIYEGKEEQYETLTLDLFLTNPTVDPNHKILYQSPFTHFDFSSDLIKDILLNTNYYKIFIEVLRAFDKAINEVKVIPFENTSEIYIQRGKDDPVPLAIYGDGIKKVMCIAANIAKANNGILLIDEIETSLHHQYFQDVFMFLIKAARSFNVQLFITTHSKETVDSFLKIGKTLDMLDSLNIYTIRNSSQKTYSRLLLGNKAYDYRINSDLEVRD